MGQLDKEELRKIIREEIKGVLERNKIKPEELDPNTKQKLDDLNNNNNNNNNNNDQSTRLEIINGVGQKCLAKLITELIQALKSKNQTEIDRKAKELQDFANSPAAYKKNAYQARKSEVEKLLTQSKNQANKSEFFRPNNPLMWVSGIALIAFIVLLVIIITRSRHPKE